MHYNPDVVAEGFLQEGVSDRCGDPAPSEGSRHVKPAHPERGTGFKRGFMSHPADPRQLALDEGSNQGLAITLKAQSA